MDDRGLYQAIQGLSASLQVEQVTLRLKAGEVPVWFAAARAPPFGCLECVAPSRLQDHVERRWRHLDTCQFLTLLCARGQGVRCATHGVRTSRVPWAEPCSRFTLLFERMALIIRGRSHPLQDWRRARQLTVTKHLDPSVPPQARGQLLMAPDSLSCSTRHGASWYPSPSLVNTT